MKTLGIIYLAFFVVASVAGCAQKMIQKKIYVYGGAGGKHYRVDKRSIQAKCARISTSQIEFENILSNNVKVVSENRWSSTISYTDAQGDTTWVGYPLEGRCYGSSYIVEGPESVLKDSK